MAMTLVLDASALAALFPEGTEARVTLQREAVKQAATHFVKGALGDEAREYLRQIAQLAKAELTAEFRNTLLELFASDMSYGQMPRLNAAQKELLANAVRRHITADVQQVIGAAVEAQLTELDGTLVEMATACTTKAVQTLINKTLVAVAQTRVNAESERILAAIQGG